jgi:hypothetical protein
MNTLGKQDDIQQKDLYYAILDGTPEDIERLLQHPNINRDDEKLWLFSTPSGYKIENIKTLLDNGVSPMHENYMALRLSICYGHKELADFLIERISDIMLKDCHAYLQAASASAQYGRIELFKEYIPHCVEYISTLFLEEIIFNPILVAYVVYNPNFNAEIIDDELIEIAEEKGYHESKTLLYYRKKYN